MSKLCQDCIAYVRAEVAEFDKCAKVPLDPVSKYIRNEPPTLSYCATQRGRQGQCGADGKLFEELPPEQKQQQLWRVQPDTPTLPGDYISLGVDTAVETPRG